MQSGQCSTYSVGLGGGGGGAAVSQVSSIVVVVSRRRQFSCNFQCQCTSSSERKRRSAPMEDHGTVEGRKRAPPVQ